MHPLSSTMERQNLQNQGDVIMGDVKQEKYSSTNSLDNDERDNHHKRYFHINIYFNKNAITFDVVNRLNNLFYTYNIYTIKYNILVTIVAR